MQIRLSKTVAAQPAEAFAVVANVLDWPHIIQSVKRIELLTPGPVREGARLREERIMFGRIKKHEMEILTIDRPHRLRVLIEHPELGHELDHLVDGVFGGGCRIMLIVRIQPATSVGHAAQPFIAPFMEITLRDETGAGLVRSRRRDHPKRLLIGPSESGLLRREIDHGWLQTAS